MGGDGVGVAGQKVLVLADSDDKRRTAASADHDVRVVGADDGDAISADDLAQRIGHGMGERVRRAAIVLGLRFADAGIVIADEVGEDFGIGGGAELVAFEMFFEPFEILDDAIVDDGDFAALVEVGMAIVVGGRSVCGPAGMAEAENTFDGMGWKQLGEAFVDLAFFLPDVDFAVLEDSEPGTVIAAIFESTEAFDENRGRLFLSDVTNDAAHKKREGFL